MLRIAFSGKAGSGKDTACDFLEKYGYKRLRFADKLYKITRFIQSELGKEVKKERKLLQGIGMFLRAHYGNNIFVDAELDRLENGQKYVVADLRFRNEAEELRRNGFILVRINRYSSSEDDDHISEIDLDDYPFDVVIDNDSDIEAFHQKIFQSLVIE
jgi:dephospho-CoA kinase